MTKSVDIHASAAAINQNAVLILGPSGSGKSHLVMKLLALGFDFIGDDSIRLEEIGEEIWAKPHPKSKNQIEIRGIGIHHIAENVEAPLKLVVDLGEAPKARLPEQEFVNQFDKKISKVNAKGFTSVEQYLYLLLTGKIEYLSPDRI